jgi:hypothetical protein
MVYGEDNGGTPKGFRPLAEKVKHPALLYIGYGRFLCVAI